MNDTFELGGGPDYYTYKWKNNTSKDTALWSFQTEGNESVWVDVSDTNACKVRQEISIKVEDCDTTVIISGIQSLSQNKIKLSPNPTLNYLNIELSSDKIYNTEINIVSIQGNIVFKKSVTFSNGLFRIDVSNLNNGIYIVHLNNGEELISHRFIKR
jgi:hypothetical protein